MNCEHCNQPMQSGRSDKRFCSKSCSKNASRQRKRLRTVSGLGGEMNCRWCHKVMTKAFAHQAYCSATCSAKFKGKQSNHAKWGGDTDDYLRRVRETRGCCSICGKEGGTSLHYDHDHSTGEPRGVLCQQCNHGLGNFKDDVALLNRASEYLSRKIANDF